ncbi:MAG: hypothetical protein HY900_11465 [Deltaproteobacteria bacterium]|nr:hypothetical protein [Deltaproteobacteria bacterium]
MRYFSLVDFKDAALAYLLGIVAVILVYMAWSSYPMRRIPRSKEEIRRLEGHEIESGHHAEENPVAPFLVLVYVGIAAWAVAYMIFVGVRGGPVGY